MKSFLLKIDEDRQQSLCQVNWPDFESCLSNVCETLSDVLNRSYVQNDEEAYNQSLHNILKLGLNVSINSQGKHVVTLQKRR